MKNIFLNDARFGEDVPTINVPKSESQWSFFLEQELLTKFPMLHGRSISVEVKQSDSGSAHGAILVNLNDRSPSGSNGGEGEAITFPFIIQEYKMFPLDVFEFDEKFNKATESNLTQLLSTEAINFATPDERPQSDEMFETHGTGMEVLNPSNVFSGKTVMASSDYKTVEKIAEVKHYLDLIQKGVAENATKLQKYAKAKAAFSKFVKVAQDFITNPSVKLHTLTKSARLRYNPDRFNYTFDYCYVDTNDNKVKSMSKTAQTLGDVEKEISEVTDPSAFIEKMRSDNEVIDAESVDNDAQLLTLSEDATNEFDTSNTYTIYSSEGRPHTGAIISNVVDFDLNVLPSKIFLGTEPPGTYAYDEKFEAKESPGSVNWDSLTTPVEQGQTVTFLIPGPTTKDPVAATFPFKILSVKSVEGDVAYVGQFLLRPGVATLIPTETVKTPVKLSGSDYQSYSKLVSNNELAYLVPKSLKSVSLDSAINTTSNIKEGELRFISRQAFQDRTKIATIIPSSISPDGYSVEHPDLDVEDGKLALASLGAIQLHPKIVNALKKKAHKMTIVIPNYKNYQLKTASTKVVKPLIDKEILIKVAAGVDDDSLSYLTLALGLVDTDSGFKFGEYINTLNDAVDKLCKLLLGARLGMPMSDSASLKMGIDALDAVTQQLRLL